MAQIISAQFHYMALLINLLVYSTYTENLVCVILVAFLFSCSLYWISPRPNDSSSLTNEKDHHYFLNSADVCW